VLLRGIALKEGRPDSPAADHTKKRSDGTEQGVNSPPMPIAWTRTANGPPGKGNKVLCITAGSAMDLQNEGLRRLVVNSVYSFTGLTVPAKADVDLVDDFKPSANGGGFIKGMKPDDHALQR
ncbi:MAG: hypothetical protein H7Y36_02665, partial [Armatimonadetes bacterium]|nr:hypothetical protein [Akkermansiaceae bacterium]